jgi:hypothetical protein
MIPAYKKKETLSWLGLFFALCGGVVWIRTATVKATYHYVQQEKELTGIGHQMQEFRIRWLKLTSPKKLEALALKMDLFPPTENQRVQYTSKGRLN